MSKILKNNSGSNVTVSDTGVTINNGNQYVIPPQDYLLWAASDDVVTEVGAGNLVVNDGSVDLGISDGIDLIKGVFQKHRVIGDTDDTLIGNVGDSLKTVDTTEGNNNIIDPNNSTSTPLAGSGSFIGTGTDVTKYCSVTIMIHADVSSATDGMKFEFSTNGTDWDESLEYNLNVAEDDTRRFTLAVNAQYFRVRYINGASAQSDFKIQTILHKSNPGLPTIRIGDLFSGDRSAIATKSVIVARKPDDTFANVGSDNDGNLQVESPSQIYGNKTNSASRDVFGRLATAIASVDIELDFSKGLNSDSFTSVTANGGTVTNSNSKLKLSSSSATNGKAEIDTLAALDYRVGTEMFATFTARWENFGTGANDLSIVGPYFDENFNDGYGIGFKGTEFGIFKHINGSETFIAQSSFNGDLLDGSASSIFTRSQSPEAFNASNLNLFRIAWGWQGSSVINFEIQSPDGAWIKFHQIKQPNSSQDPSILKSSLTFHAKVEKNGGAQDLIFESAAISLGFLGDRDGKESSGNTTTTQLAADEVFTGQGIKVLQFSQINVSLTSDVDSATGGIEMQYSGDGSQWFTVNSFTLDVSEEPIRLFQLGIYGKFFRIKYTNGSAATSQFQIQTLLLQGQNLTRLQRIEETLTGDTPVTATKSVLAGESDTLGYINVGTTDGGRLKVDIEADSVQPLPVELPLVTDMTSRLKVARTNRIFSSTWQYDKQPRSWTERITGGASITAPGQKDPAYLKLSTTTADGDLIEFGTKRYIKYRPFRTHEISMSNILGPGDANCIQRFGQFTTFNGWYFERQANNYYACIRNNTNQVSGTTTTKIERANWNVDKLDGTGPSGIDLAPGSETDGSLENAITWVIEYVWHGTQGIKFGIQYFDQIIWCHFFRYSASDDVPFARTALLPLKYEMENDGALSAATDWYIGPCSFNIEDGEEALGERHTISNMTTGKTISSSSVPTYLLALRPKATINGSNNRGFLVPINFNIYTTDDVLVELVYLAQISTATWNSVGAESIAEYATDVVDANVSNEEVIQSVYVSGGGNSNAQVTTTIEARIFSALDALNSNTPLCIAIRAYKLGGNATSYAALDFREVN